MVYVALYYYIQNDIDRFNIREGTLGELKNSLELFKENVADLELRLQKFESAMAVASQNQTQCDVYIVRFGESDSNTLIARIEHDDSNAVKSSVRSYLSISGLPHMIGRGSDYGLAREVLAEYGKDLKVSFWSKDFEASVIDKPKTTGKKFSLFGLLTRVKS